MKYFAFLVLILVLPGRAIAQGLQTSRYASATQIYQAQSRADDKIEQLHSQMLATVEASQQSPNAQFWLKQAIEKAITFTNHQLSSSLKIMQDLGKLAGLDTSTLFQLEKELKLQLTQKDQLDLLLADLEPSTTSSITAVELDFYQISNGYKVGELGAGDLSFIHQLSSQMENGVFYVNDILPTSVQDFATVFHLSPFYQKQSSTFHAVQGSASSTYLEGRNLDVMIIRNAIHHFEDLPNMLRSIKASLHADGILYLKEAFDGDCQKDCCPHLMEKNHLLLQLERQGFQLQEQQTFQNAGTKWHLLAFRKGEV